MGIPLSSNLDQFRSKLIALGSQPFHLTTELLYQLALALLFEGKAFCAPFIAFYTRIAETVHYRLYMTDIQLHVAIAVGVVVAAVAYIGAGVASR